MSKKESPDRQIMKRSDAIPKNFTAADMVDWCFQRNLDPREVHLTGGHMFWESVETDEEMERRLKFWKERDDRHEAWERDMLAKLKEKYGE
jgi:hypothetical protein